MAEPWWSSWPPSIVPYAVLLKLLIAGRVTGAEFEAMFLHFYKRDTTEWPPELFDVLDSFFADVDDFCADPELRARVDGLDEGELRHRAHVTYQRLAEHAS